MTSLPRELHKARQTCTSIVSMMKCMDASPIAVLTPPGWALREAIV